MGDIFEQMSLPGVQDYEMSPQGFRMKGAEHDTEEDEFGAPVKFANPEVKNAMVKKASDDLEKSGIKKSDPRHASLLDIELALRLAQAEENHPGIQGSLRTSKIREIMSTWGYKAPKMLQALGLTHRDAAKPTSKEEVLLGYLKAKQAGKQAAQDRELKRSILQTNMDMKKMALEDKLLKSQEARQEKSAKKLIGPLNRKIDKDISHAEKKISVLEKAIEDKRGYVNDKVIQSAIKRKGILEKIRSDLFKVRGMSDMQKKQEQADLLGSALILQGGLN